MSAAKNDINELSEILGNALSERPDLSKRLSILLGGSLRGARPKGDRPITFKQRKQQVRDMFSTLHLQEKLNKPISEQH